METYYPLTQSQLGIFLSSISHADDDPFVLRRLIEIDPSVDLGRFAESISAAIAAHPSLSVTLDRRDGIPVMLPPDGPVRTKVEVEEVSDELWPAVLGEYSNEKIDLLGGLLYRLHLVQTPRAKYCFLAGHHIIADGLSVLRLIDDIFGSYMGNEIPVEAPFFWEYAAQEEEYRKSPAFEEDRAWFKEKYSSLEVDSMPLGNGQGREDGHYRSYYIPLSVSASSINGFCHERKMARNSLAIAAYSLLTGIYTNQKESLVTFPWIGRDRSLEVQPVGMYVRTLPFYIRWEDGTSVEEFLRSADSHYKDLKRHSAFSLVDLGEFCSTSGCPSFGYHGEIRAFNALLGGKSCKVVELGIRENVSPLLFQLMQDGDSLVVKITCDNGRFDSTFAHGFVETYDTILSQLMKVENLSQVDPLSAGQKALLDSFNETDHPYDEKLTVVDRFRRMAAASPDARAVITEEGTLTYGELDRISDSLACYLHSQGLGRGDVVAVLVPRGQYMPITALGALKAGCAYQPLDSSYPKERLSFMVKDASCRMVLSTAELLPLIGDEYKGDSFMVTQIQSLPGGRCDWEAPGPEDLFVLLYTSGSTGTPKGVCLCHRNLSAFADFFARRVEMSPSDVMGNYASFGFDAAQHDIFVPLTVGASVCIIPEEVRLDLEKTHSFMEEHSVTVQFMTTQLGMQYANEYPSSSLRVLLMGGEKLLPVGKTSYRLVNGYGPSECTCGSSYYDITGQDKDIPIGKPNDNLKFYIVDSLSRRLPLGAVGELWISGNQVGLGYLNRPEKTKEAFTQNPFDSGKYSRVYHSGDIVRYLSDGNLAFVGRGDSQVKIRGFRIELSEVEIAIKEHPSVKDVTVQAPDHPSGGKYLVAYVVPREKDKFDASSLKEFLGRSKPPYMVPSVIIVLDSIPLTRNGKVDRKALPAPQIGAPAGAAALKNLGELEKDVLSIVSESIGTGEIPFDVPLSELGLASIAAIKMSVRIYKDFAVQIPSTELMKSSFTSICQTVEESLPEEKKARKSDAATPKEGPRMAPLSASQEGVYLQCVKHPVDCTYNIPVLLRFSLDASADEIRKAVGRIIQAHPSCNIHFETVDGEVMQVFSAPGKVDVPLVEMKEDEIDDFKAHCLEPFVLSKGPLYRFALVKTEKYLRLFYDFHHLAFDGMSSAIFMENLRELLGGRDIQDESFTYFDHAVQEREFLEKDTANKEFFDSVLKDFDSAPYPSPDLRGKEEEGREKTLVQEIPLAVEFCKSNHLSQAAFYASVSLYTLGRYSTTRNVYMTTVSSGRADVRNASTFGMFVNTLPLHGVIGDGTVEEYMKEVAENFDGAIAHEKYPFARLASDYSFTPEVMFAYQKGVGEMVPIPHLQSVEIIHSATPKFKLNISIEGDDDKSFLSLSYNDALYSEAFIREFAHSFSIVCSTMLSDPKAKVRSISLIDDEREKALSEIRNATKDPLKKTYTLFHEGIEEQAALKPGEIALVGCDARYTFARMDEEANRIANALIALGVKKGSRIALLLPRTSRYVLSVIGVLKAGCAFIPCDPEYPADRIQYILEDSGAVHIITTPDRMDSVDKAKGLDVEELLKCKDTCRPDVDIKGSDLAYLIYTSGSTGRPKGVMLTHAGAANFFTAHPANIMQYYLRTKTTMFVALATFSFDMSIDEIFTSLFNGVAVTIASEEQTRNAEMLSSLMASVNADVIMATPSRLLQYMELPSFCQALSKCKVIVFGGEKVLEGLLPKLRSITQARLVNSYGPTEITVACNSMDLTDTDIVTAGRPQYRMTEFIVDPDGNELPVGVTGELCVASPGVALGYNNLPEKTAEVFVDFTSHSGQTMRVYRTGDYARWTPEGNVQILGRTDSQVKLRGLRIELGEVESVLAQQPGVKQSIVKIGKIGNVEHLCAYFTADRPLDVNVLREEMGKRLTKYMVPTAFMQLDTFPVTPNGKTDMKALPVAKVARSTSESDKPATKAERDFCEIFALALQMDQVGAEENFFDLGGSSLLVTRVLVEAGKRGYELSFQDIFSRATPRALAGLFDDDAAQDGTGSGDDGIGDYPYAELDPVVKGNTLEAFIGGERRPLGNVLITGGVGYLAIHILHEFLQNYKGKAYCLLRGKDSLSAENRLKTMLFYYFEDSMERLFGKRIFVIDGDVTKALDPSLKGKVDTVINCAALVKHFSAATDIIDVNVGGVENLVGFCLENGAALVQVSTRSTVELIAQDALPEKDLSTEKDFYFGQDLSNQYVRSKFLGERVVLEAVAKKGLTGKIMRVGNLSPRYSDGEFQINFGTNSSMGNLRVFSMLGCCPYAQLDRSIEFSPIEQTAKAVLLLSQTPRENVIFHPYHHQQMPFGYIFGIMGEEGMPIRPLEEKDFIEALHKAQEDSEKLKILTSIMAYKDASHETRLRALHAVGEQTLQILHRMGFSWPLLDLSYISSFIQDLKGLGYFDFPTVDAKGEAPAKKK